MRSTSKRGHHARPDKPPRQELPPTRPMAGRGEEPPGGRSALVVAAGLRGRDAPGGRNGRETRARRVPFFAVVALSLSVLASAACGGAGGGGASAADAKAGQESASAPKTTATEKPQNAERGKAGVRAGKAGARAGEAVARGDAARAGEVRAGGGSVAIEGTSGGDTGGSGKPLKVTLQVTGDPKTDFSGACSVGKTERTLAGRVPERYVFEPSGKRLECELRTEDGGALGILLTDGAGVRSEQRTTGGERTVEFVYSNGSVSSSTSSVSEGRSVTYSNGSTSEGSR